MKKNKGVSPVIATVLLISMVVVLALIVILWFMSLTKEAITKFDGQNVEIVCRDVSFEASFSSGILSVENTGSVPIFSAKIKEENYGEFETKDVTGWPKKGLNPGQVFSSSLTINGQTIIIIPVLAGESESGMQSFICNEEQGYKINVI